MSISETKPQETETTEHSDKTAKQGEIVLTPEMFSPSKPEVALATGALALCFTFAAVGITHNVIDRPATLHEAGAESIPSGALHNLTPYGPAIAPAIGHFAAWCKYDEGDPKSGSLRIDEYTGLLGAQNHALGTMRIVVNDAGACFGNVAPTPESVQPFLPQLDAITGGR